MSFQLRDKDIIWSCNERERETEREKWGIEVEGGGTPQRMPNFKVINCELPQPDRGRRKKLQFGSEVEGERDPERSPSFSTFLSLCPLSLLKGPARVSGQQLSVP